MRRKLRSRLFLTILSVICLAAVMTTAVHVYAAQSYNSGAYDGCAYSVGCDPAPPATVVPVPPSTGNPQPGRAFSVNLANDQKLKGPSFTVMVTPNFSVDQIKNVEFYQDGQLISTVLKPNGGSYDIKWGLPKGGNYTVKVVMNLTDGTVIEKNFNINVVDSNEPPSPVQNSSDNSTKTSNRASSSPASESPLSRLFAPTTNFLRRVALATPKPLAYAMPYIVLALLGLLLITLIFQTRNQLIYIASLLKLLERDKQLADEKANFIMLASHYIRTPLTILSGNIELALMGRSGDALLLQSKASTDELHRRSEQILDDIQQNKDLLNIKAPDIKIISSNLYHSLSLIGPIILSALLIIGINILYVSARRINLIVPSIVAQFILLVVLSSFLYSLIKRRNQQREQQLKVTQQRGYEEALDKARNQFIMRSAEELSPLVSRVKDSFVKSESLQTSQQVGDAFGQLESLIKRFVLVTELERGKIEKSLTNFDIEQNTKETLAEFEEPIAAKKLRVSEYLKSIQLHQSQNLLKYVTSILIDNAVKFTPEAGRASVKSGAQGRHAATLSISNHGEAIDPEKLDRLFMPFSRTQSAEVSNDSGAGLSLYLSRLIMRYLGGDIELSSDSSGTTTAKVSLPRQAEV